SAKLVRRLHQFNRAKAARRRVAHHYDLSGRLYDLFLDDDRQYSCAYFETGRESLEEAQWAKKQHIAAKLLLKPGHKVLDIGSGWGGLGLHLARTADVDLEGITLSQEQHDLSNKRAKEAGLSCQVRFHLRDYRAQQGCFDRIVSVGMFEHVGVGYFTKFFEKMNEVLKDDGVALLHTIGRSSGAGVTDPWMRKYIFPGGYIPSLSEILPPIEKAGLMVTDVEVLGSHYAETLHIWLNRFLANWDQVAQLYDDRFCRMWEFYLASCEAVFREMDLTVFQIQLAKGPGRVPFGRNYIAQWEQDQQEAEKSGKERAT
ncbi:MAG: cyclopropane-fatty-acyl-phospholipid synthase family protein, partial [Rhodospirillales bacterium]|nr:cyclopropane-fatty-acyl-phospholipid synthase family protein [Rhodospirillales bacterium]